MENEEKKPIVVVCTECGVQWDLSVGHSCGEVLRKDRLNLVIELRRAHDVLTTISANIKKEDRQVFDEMLQDALQGISNTLKTIRLTDGEKEIILKT